MNKICPKCGAIAEYNAYYGRITCTSCAWEGEVTKFTFNNKAIVNNTNDVNKQFKKAKILVK